MNKSQAVAGNVTREEAAEFLREMGIESLRKRAGKIAEAIPEDTPITIDWKPVIRVACWRWHPTSSQMKMYKDLLIDGNIISYCNSDTSFTYRIGQSLETDSQGNFYPVNWIVRKVWCDGEERHFSRIHIQNLEIVCLWLAYCQGEQIPF